MAMIPITPNDYSEGVKITEVTSAQTLNAGASLLVTQPESGKESLRRVPLAVAGLATEAELSELETRIKALENLTNLDEVSF